MLKSNVINLPIRHTAIGEENTFWLIAVAAGAQDDYSCEYDTKHGGWKLKVKASTFQGAEAMINECRRILGWDVPTNGKEAEAK